MFAPQRRIVFAARQSRVHVGVSSPACVATRYGRNGLVRFEARKLDRDPLSRMRDYAFGPECHRAPIILKSAMPRDPRARPRRDRKWPALFRPSAANTR